jgi:uncharacterized membrane protein YwzB
LVVGTKMLNFSFIGMKVIFWDLQQPLIDNLYKNSVPQARLDTIMEVLDLVSLVIFYLSR